MDKLDADLHGKILENLNPRDLARVGGVNKALRTATMMLGDGERTFAGRSLKYYVDHHLEDIADGSFQYALVTAYVDPVDDGAGNVVTPGKIRLDPLCKPCNLVGGTL